eukprot:TRINITY_DN812_c0_g1_i2.p1 TRINITY_DN812_c0_g1~~TRINITY_DN812_c0_g1_i2.p1  ORF type:complete len:218 (-),score=41.38 TRINITY_DN812_c0_g1_i2:196-849(-)
MSSVNQGNQTTETAAPAVSRITHEPAIKETIIPQTTTIIQPIIHREIERTEIHKIVQPIYEKSAPVEYQETISAQGVRQSAPVSEIQPAQPVQYMEPFRYGQQQQFQQQQQQTTKKSGGLSNRLSFLSKRRSQSSLNLSNTQTSATPVANNDASYHGFHGLRRSKTTSNIPQTQYNDIGEVPANNIPVYTKRRNPFRSLFGRKNRDSGGHLRTTEMV